MIAEQTRETAAFSDAPGTGGWRASTGTATILLPDFGHQPLQSGSTTTCTPGETDAEDRYCRQIAQTVCGRRFIARFGGVRLLASHVLGKQAAAAQTKHRRARRLSVLHFRAGPKPRLFHRLARSRGNEDPAGVPGQISDKRAGRGRHRLGDAHSTGLGRTACGCCRVAKSFRGGWRLSPICGLPPPFSTGVASDHSIHRPFQRHHVPRRAGALGAAACAFHMTLAWACCCHCTRQAISSGRPQGDRDRGWRHHSAPDLPVLKGCSAEVLRRQAALLVLLRRGRALGAGDAAITRYASAVHCLGTHLAVALLAWARAGSCCGRRSSSFLPLRGRKRHRLLPANCTVHTLASICCWTKLMRGTCCTHDRTAHFFG